MNLLCFQGEEAVILEKLIWAHNVFILISN